MSYQKKITFKTGKELQNFIDSLPEGTGYDAHIDNANREYWIEYEPKGTK